MKEKKAGQVYQKPGKKWTEKTDDAYDKKHGIKENSKRDLALDKKRGLKK